LLHATGIDPLGSSKLGGARLEDRGPQQWDDRVDAALNSAEGLAIVLADLKTLLESGKPAGISRDKRAQYERVPPDADSEPSSSTAMRTTHHAKE
jgi:hypothetical protein